MKKFILLIGCCLSLLSCKDSFFISESEQSLYSLSEEEINKIAPNKLFVAVYKNQNTEDIKDIIDNNPSYLSSVNEEGDTPLGLAIKIYRIEIARYLISQLTVDALTHRNHKGEGYVYLSAQRGHADLIENIADKLYKKPSLFGYEFSNIDLKTNAGEKSLHVAKNNLVAEVLKTEYYRGVLELPFRGFSYATNSARQNFLHTAVLDNRVSVLAWGVDNNCPQVEHEPYSSNWIVEIVHWVSDVIGSTWDVVNIYSNDWTGFALDNIVNKRDKNKDTPINLAAKNLLLDSVQILMNCSLIDYSLEDGQGNTPLQNYLMALDAKIEFQNQELKDVFTSLAENRPPFTIYTAKSVVDHLNDNGESAMHIAARIYDPFFYNYLKKYGDVKQKNPQGKTPEDIFNNIQTRVTR